MFGGFDSLNLRSLIYLPFLQVRPLPFFPTRMKQFTTTFSVGLPSKLGRCSECVEWSIKWQLSIKIQMRQLKFQLVTGRAQNASNRKVKSYEILKSTLAEYSSKQYSSSKDGGLSLAIPSPSPSMAPVQTDAWQTGDSAWELHSIVLLFDLTPCLRFSPYVYDWYD